MYSMTEPFYDDRTFTGIDLSNTAPKTKEFDGCSFTSCNFSGSDFSGINFIDCRFDECNLSLIKLTGTGLKNVEFAGCKIIGVDFSVATDLLLSVKFEKCNLEFSHFYKKKLKNTSFKDCKIKEANFTETDLTGSAFIQCDLLNTVFDRTILHSVDFRTSYNYTLDPAVNIIKKAKFSYQGVIGLLYKHDIVIE